MNLPVYYLDTCVLIAMVKRDLDDQVTQRGVDELRSLMERGQCQVLCSAVTRVEFFDSTSNDWEFFDGRRALLAGITQPVLDLASEIRKRAYIKLDQGGKSRTYCLSTTDAIHIATAIHFNVHRLFTVDGKRKLVDRQENATILSVRAELLKLFNIHVECPEGKERQASLPI